MFGTLSRQREKVNVLKRDSAPEARAWLQVGCGGGFRVKCVKCVIPLPEIPLLLTSVATAARHLVSPEPCSVFFNWIQLD